MTTAVPTVTEVATALGVSQSDVQPFYDAELADQRSRCRTETYNDALAGALIRRVKRARAMSNLPLGVMVDETGATRLGSSDPEVRRLEAPYRKLPVG